MGECYSVDLRERVISYVDGGHSRQQAAEHFGVSPSFAVKLLARRAGTGSVEPACQGRPKGGGKLAPYEDLWQAPGNICHLFEPEECWNDFRASGYASD